MKYMFASDVHGSAFFCRKMLEAYREEKAEKLILLGDILYHGPRNDLPKDYAPKKVIELLNGIKNEILCVRGNCDTEVDQMVLEFPVLADYAVIFVDGKTLYLTHGHKYNPNNLPPIKKGDYLVNGHTHILANDDEGSRLLARMGELHFFQSFRPHGKRQNFLYLIPFPGNIRKR